MKKIQTFTFLRGILKIRWPTPSADKNCGYQRDGRLQKMTFFKVAGDGSVTPSASLHPASQSKPSAGILKGKGREADEETPGAVTWRQT